MFIPMDAFNTNTPAAATSQAPFGATSPPPLGATAATAFVQEQQFLSPHPHSASQSQPISSGGGASSSSNRRPRGRPPGSKNKPKLPVIHHDTPNTLQAVVMEIPAGADVMERLHNFVRASGRGFCVLSVAGTVSNVNIRDSLSSGVLTYRGSYKMMALTGAMLPPPAPSEASGLSIFLSAGPGRVLGGRLVGPLVATENVYLVIGSFETALFERSQVQVQVQAAEGNAGGWEQPPPSSAGTLPLFHAERNVAPPTPAPVAAPYSPYASEAPPSPYAFPADFVGYGGYDGSPMPSI